DPFQNGVLSTYTSGGSAEDSFNIQLLFEGNQWTVALQQAFVDATEFLSDIIIGDTQDTPSVFGRDPVDDLQIEVNLESIDGVNNTLAFAGPRGIGNEDLPYSGTSTFDVADAERLNDRGQLDDVVVHEFFHVLGFGTIFNREGLLENNRFVGEFTTQLYNDVYTEISDNDPGSANGLPTQQGGGHFAEGVFEDELNTPVLDFSGNYLSTLSVAALEDLGYDTFLDNPFDPDDLFGPAPTTSILDTDFI
ncbi:MAG: hypothetical protein AAFQ66_20255, partial [Pseudomonadota bacterium]